MINRGHVGAGFLAMTGILLRIHDQDGNGKCPDEKRKRVSDRASRLAAGIPRDDNVLGDGSSPMLRQ